MIKNRLITIVLAVVGCLMAVNAAERMKMATNILTAKTSDVPLLENPIYNPEGTDETFIMNVTENSYWGEENVDGYKMTIRRSADGKKIYFQDLTPGYNGDDNTEGYSWVEGYLNGDDITIPAGQVLYKSPNQTLYLQVITVDEFGQVKEFKNNIHFTFDGENIKQADNSEYIGVYENGETNDDAGFFIFMNNFEIMPISDIVTYTPPTGVEVEQWMMTSGNGSRFVKVARDGNKVYIAGLSTIAPNDYIVGTIENGQLIFRSGSILTSGTYKYIRLIGASEGEPDEWGNPQLNMTSGFVFDINETEDHFTLTPYNDYIVEASYFSFTMLNGINNVEIFRYAGDVAATPANPEIKIWSEADAFIQINVPCHDVNGNFINPNKITYRIYLDGEPHLFTPEAYEYLTESMTDIPYNFTDQFDIYSNGTIKTIYLHAPAFKTLEVQSTYTVNGDSRSSDRIQFSGIDAIEADHGTIENETYTDILGRTVTHPTQGSLLIKTTTYSDGTQTITKHIVR